MLYKCDKKTPAKMWTDKNMVLDISSDEVIEWQLRGADNMYSVERLVAQGFDAIAADNCKCHGDSFAGSGVPQPERFASLLAVGFSNAWGACGVWRNGTWTQLFSGKPRDPDYTQANVRWMQRFHAGVRKFKTKSGQPMLLTPNWGIGGSQRYDDPEVLAVGNATDGALSEW